MDALIWHMLLFGTVYDRMDVFLQGRLDRMRTVQEQVKTTERDMISEHDYTNILAYFKVGCR